MTSSRSTAITLFSLTSLIACGASQPAATQAPSAAIADAGPAAAVVKDPAPVSEDDSPIPITPRDPTWGARTAPVTIVSFSDFQCPFCARAAATLGELQREYGPEKLRIVWKNEPLPFHPNARPAAEASMGIFALGGNDAFWRFEDSAFRHQDQLSTESYERWAELANVDLAQLRRGLLAHTWSAKVDEDHALATKLGVNGTPAFYINGVSLGGAQPLPKFTAIIDDELRKANALLAAGTPRERVYVASSTENWKNRPPPSDDEDDDDAPDTRTWRIPIGSGPLLGSKEAPVTIVEYCDFQCPFCRRAQDTLKQVRARYGDKVRIVWKNEPLPNHPRALPAAELAYEARAQKGDAGFWAAHEKIYDGQKNLEDADLAAIATSLKLDVKKVQGAIAMQRYKRIIEADADEADGFLAIGTPHFFINGRRLVGAQPFEQFQAMIDEELVKAAALSAKGIAASAIYDELTKDGSLPPPPQMKTVAAAAKNAPARGNASAKIVVQEFSDFQCPFCKRVEATLDEVMKNYGSRAKLVWRNTPLPFHPNAEPAAEAAMEAYAQKGNAGFWKMHDLLFTNQGTPDGLKRESLDKYAKELGLDMTKFAAAIDGHAHQAAIDADTKAASDAGISGTPSFVINGYYVSGAQPYGKFRAAIERALADGAAPKAK